MDGQTKESKQNYKCKHCNREYSKESTLIAHVCEPKRRFQQQNETGVQLGLRAYLRFYETTQGGSKTKTYNDFASSPYYNAFVKFGRHLVGIRAVNPTYFIDWLLKNNKKLDYWCKDAFYDEWLRDYLRKENYQDALERGIKEMIAYADDHPDLKNGFTDYFRYGNSNRICHHICTGRISPWVIFSCDSGGEFLSNLDPGQMALVMPWIDPDYWNQYLRDHKHDRMDAVDILKAAGL